MRFLEIIDKPICCLIVLPSSNRCYACDNYLIPYGHTHTDDFW